MRPLFLIDGFNLLHAVVLKGRARKEWSAGREQLRVVELCSGFDGGEVRIIFDARGADRVQGNSRVSVEFASNADDHIVQCCRDLAGAREVVVVSADRALCDRARHRGASRMSPWKFAERCAGGAGNQSLGTLGGRDGD